MSDILAPWIRDCVISGMSGFGCGLLAAGTSHNDDKRLLLISGVYGACACIHLVEMGMYSIAALGTYWDSRLAEIKGDSAPKTPSYKDSSAEISRIAEDLILSVIGVGVVLYGADRLICSLEIPTSLETPKPEIGFV